MSERLQAIALGVIVDESEVLLVEHVNPKIGQDGKSLDFAFPGGKVEPKEWPEDAAVREILEESGLRTEAVAIIDERPHPNFPVFVSYIGCRLVAPRSELVPVTDPAIKCSLWVPGDRLEQTFSTTINERVAWYVRDQIKRRAA